MACIGAGMCLIYGHEYGLYMGSIGIGTGMGVGVAMGMDC